MANLVCKCGYWFDESVCPGCGKLQNAKQQRREKSRALKTASIARDIQANPRAAQAKNLIERMFADYGLEGSSVMRNCQACYCHQHGDKKSYTIVLSWENIGRFIEWVTFAWLWDWDARNVVEGPKATWACAIHEFAHVLQFEADGVWAGKGGHHNSIWAAKVQELQELYPYNAQLKTKGNERWKN